MSKRHRGSVATGTARATSRTAPRYTEKFYFSPGDTGFKVWNTKAGTIGVGICWDQWFPEAARSMALMGAEVLSDRDRLRGHQIAAVEKQIETLLSRILDVSNATVVRNYENKISELERGKVLLAEKLAHQAEPKGKFEEQLEPALTFLATPWKLW